VIALGESAGGGDVGGGGDLGGVAMGPAKI